MSEGKRLGPMTLEEIRDRIADGRLGRSDKVWAEGFTDWRPAGSVDALFPPGPPPLPEPASGDAVTLLRDGLADVQGRLRSGWAGVDRWAWALVTVPVVGALIELLAGRVIVLLFFFLNSVCGVADERRLRFAGLRAPNAWWAAIVVPVYLWKRAANLRRPPVHFGLWCASFVVALILSLSVETRELEDAARPLVTQIIRQQVGEQGARCIRVRIIEDVGDGYYRAIATLDNGNDLRVVIESRGRMVYVRVAP